jgi:phosphoribosylformylglycinamidine (FGAM) synthase-like amidotransferase family enzyme
MARSTGFRVAVYHGARNVSGARVAEALKRSRIPFAMIHAEEIESGGLDDFAAVIFPGGHSIALGKKGVAEVKRFVEAGGGFLGICAGCQFAARIGLLRVRIRFLRASGIFDMRVARSHPVTRGYGRARRWKKHERWTYLKSGRIRMRYCNGGMLKALKGADALVSFDEADEFAAVIAGTCGKGRVVLVSGHPESTPPASQSGAFASDADASPEPRRLFANAVKWIAEIPSSRRDGKTHGTTPFRGLRPCP